MGLSPAGSGAARTAHPRQARLIQQARAPASPRIRVLSPAPLSVRFPSLRELDSETGRPG